MAPILGLRSFHRPGRDGLSPYRRVLRHPSPRTRIPPAGTRPPHRPTGVRQRKRRPPRMGRLPQYRRRAAHPRRGLRNGLCEFRTAELSRIRSDRSGPLPDFGILQLHLCFRTQFLRYARIHGCHPLDSPRFGHPDDLPACNRKRIESGLSRTLPAGILGPDRRKTSGKVSRRAARGDRSPLQTGQKEDPRRTDRKPLRETERREILRRSSP